MLVIITHEGAHALSAVALGFPSTLFNFWVDHQFTGQPWCNERSLALPVQ
jgi:hypothetical protein